LLHNITTTYATNKSPTEAAVSDWAMVTVTLHGVTSTNCPPWNFTVGDELTFVVLLVRAHRLQSALVHSLGPNVELVLFKLVIGHGCS